MFTCLLSRSQVYIETNFCLIAVSRLLFRCYFLVRQANLFPFNYCIQYCKLFRLISLFAHSAQNALKQLLLSKAIKFEPS